MKRLILSLSLVFLMILTVRTSSIAAESNTLNFKITYVSQDNNLTNYWAPVEYSIETEGNIEMYVYQSHIPWDWTTGPCECSFYIISDNPIQMYIDDVISEDYAFVQNGSVRYYVHHGMYDSACREHPKHFSNISSDDELLYESLDESYYNMQDEFIQDYISGKFSGNTNNILSSAGQYNVQVSANIVSTFEITMPSVVSITESGIREVTFSNKGRISSTEYLEITIPKSVTLTSDTKEDVVAGLTLNQNLFNSDELSGEGTDAILSIDASELQSGEYEGDFDVNVRLTKYNYQLPQGLDFKPYIIVYRNSETNAEIIATTDCKLEYHPGFSCIGYYEQNPTQYATSYTKSVGSSNWSESSVNVSVQFIKANYEILYCNYDIMNRETGEIWK